jgi:predicted acetylornithine/succinylornithine family transaminase
MNTYARYDLTLVSGEGCRVTDDRGGTYLDFGAGIAVSALGHGHPRLAEALAEQAKKLIHISNLYWNAPQAELARKLAENSGLDRVFFCNSGAEAVEGAMKLARRFGGARGRFEIIAMENSFHGRTFGAITATGQKKYQKGLEPLLPGVKHAVFNDIDSLRAAITPQTAAVLLEPIQGESGIRPAGREYLAQVARLCGDEGILFIADEVQCGCGRTGALFACQNYGVYPDVIVTAKGLAGGVPMGAILAREEVASAWGPGDHASTFGGGPLAAAAANVVIDELTGGVMENVRANGAYLMKKLVSISEKYPVVKEIRGMGFMLGMELDAPAREVVSRCMERGLLLIGAGERVLRFTPPLVAGAAEIDECAGILSGVLEAL